MNPEEPTTPTHHLRYQRAWALHQDPNISDVARGFLEREMDSAQESFGWDEFQAFKETLPGYLDFWRNQKYEWLCLLQRMQSLDASNKTA